MTVLDPFGDAIARALAAGPNPLEQAEARALRNARRTRRVNARQGLTGRVFLWLSSPFAAEWGDRALWVLCLFASVGTIYSVTGR